MNEPLELDRVGDIAANYDALLCDAWGVIHDGRALFDGAAEFLQTFRAERGPVIILTNAPKPSDVIPGQLDRLGLPRDAYDRVVTSGDATRAEIAKCASGVAHRIGWDSDEVLYAGIDVTFGPLCDADFIVCTGLADESGYNPEYYRPLLEAPAKAGKDMICANPDIVVNWRGQLIYCAGAVAQIYEQMGGHVIYAGKPHPAVYELAFDAITEEAGVRIPPDRILAIGDGANTDILGANRQNVDAIYITGAGGVHGGADDGTSIKDALHKFGAHAMAHAQRLTW